ncbi:MAG TPA: hypothetical protein V6D28_07925 [Leptolyngbyaceae cyanobacterium]
MSTIQNIMRSKILTAITTIAILSIALPSHAGCKCNNQMVARTKILQNQSSLEQWRTEIKRRYGISSYSIPVTNQFGATAGTNANAETWRNEMKRRYGIRNYPTPVTNQFGGKNSAEWYRRLSYGRPTPVTDNYYRR